jgi:hypothetical protein
MAQIGEGSTFAMAQSGEGNTLYKVDWTSKIGASMVFSENGGICIPSDVSNLPYGREQHKAMHRRLKDGLLRHASIDMGERDNSIRRTDEKGRLLVTAIDLIMMTTGQDFAQAQQSYERIHAAPHKQPNLELQQRAVAEAERNARELIEIMEKEKLTARPSSRKARRKMVQLSKIQESEAADCVICLEPIKDDDVYCINASCGHILYCSPCARKALDAPDKYTRCPVCYIETPCGVHCISSCVALAKGIQPRVYGKS